MYISTTLRDAVLEASCSHIYVSLQVTASDETKASFWIEHFHMANVALRDSWRCRAGTHFATTCRKTCPHDPSALCLHGLKSPTRAGVIRLLLKAAPVCACHGGHSVWSACGLHFSLYRAAVRLKSPRTRWAAREPHFSPARRFGRLLSCRGRRPCCLSLQVLARP